MRFNNTIKLIFANFKLFWKILLYKVLAIGLAFLLLLPVWNPIKTACVSGGLFGNFLDFCADSAFNSIPALFVRLYELVHVGVVVVKNLVSTNLFAFIYLCLDLFLVLPFLLKMCEIPSEENIYGYMSSLSNNSFITTYAYKLKKSVKYSITRTLIQLPLIVGLLFGGYFLLNLVVVNKTLQIIIPLVIIMLGLVIISLYISLFSGFAPAMVVFNVGVKKGLSKGFKAIFRDYIKIFSNFFVMTFISLSLVMLFGGFSILVITVMSTLFIYVFQMVMFFESQGMRYYVDLEKIITPRKLEESDLISKIKDIL